ncbi:hypothetical protein C8J56DRAFT_980034 [Mycena floridula]|nr:hypothetical protein C8J56DRAFT_980034 [Mycena floridula]
MSLRRESLMMSALSLLLAASSTALEVRSLLRSLCTTFAVDASWAMLPDLAAAARVFLSFRRVALLSSTTLLSFFIAALSALREATAF